MLKKILEISLMVCGGLAIVGGITWGIIYLFSISRTYESYDSGSYSVSEQSYIEEESITKDSSDYTSSNTESLIQKSGTVDISVDDLDTSSRTIQTVLDKYNGTILSNYESGEGNDKYISITLKVESESFEDLYDGIRNIDGEVTYASYYTDDVTLEYTDLESRLRNLQAAEASLLELLDSAKSVSDTLSVYTELTEIRSEIEVIEGELKYYDNQIDYSYLTVNLSLSDSGKAVTDDEWDPFGVLKTAFSALVNVGIFLADAVIWVFVFIPVAAVIFGIVWLIKRKNTKK